MKTASRWFILLSGVYDVPIGLGLIATAPTADAATHGLFVSIVTLGALLVFCGAVLIWASRDIAARGPVIAWQGLVRLVAVAAIAVALHRGYLPAATVTASAVAGVIDLIFAIGYFVITVGVWRWRPVDLLLGRSRV